MPKNWSESRDHVDRMVPLKRVPASVRFVSAEPLLESLLPINLEGIHQVITGGSLATAPGP